MNDFGKRLEAALNRQTTSVLHGADTWVSLLAAVRAANAQVSAPSRPCTCHPDDSPPNPCAEKYALSECKKSGARVDLADAMCEVKHAADGDIEWANLAQHEARALLARIESLERDAERYRHVRQIDRNYDWTSTPPSTPPARRTSD